MPAVTDLAADSPEELLALLLADGFGKGAEGVPTLYAYASGKLRSRLGDLAVFQRAFGNELYAPLLHARNMSAAEPAIIDSSARVELRTRQAGESVTYQLGMARERSGERAGRWCVSGLFREGVDL